MFGGEGRRAFLNDTWAFDLTSDAWIEVATGERGPKPRIDHQAVYDSRSGSVLVYGGDSGLPHGKFHDIWELTFARSVSERREHAPKRPASTPADGEHSIAR